MNSTLIRDGVIKAIDIVISECLASQEKATDVVVASELSALRDIRLRVQCQWPLPQEIKSRLNIGPVAAKNITDWNRRLGNLLMILHHVLKNDGDSLQKLLGGDGPPKLS